MVDLEEGRAGGWGGCRGLWQDTPLLGEREVSSCPGYSHAPAGGEGGAVLVLRAGDRVLGVRARSAGGQGWGCWGLGVRAGG